MNTREPDAPYESNRACRCARCIRRGLIWPVFLIALGLLFLFDEFHVIGLSRTWPILLIVLGATSVLGSAADSSGHVQPHPPGPALTPPPLPPADNSQKQVEHV